jgi:hypothetical protein
MRNVVVVLELWVGGCLQLAIHGKTKPLKIFLALNCCESWKKHIFKTHYKKLFHRILKLHICKEQQVKETIL